MIDLSVPELNLLCATLSAKIRDMISKGWHVADHSAHYQYQRASSLEYRLFREYQGKVCPDPAPLYEDMGDV